MSCHWNVETVLALHSVHDMIVFQCVFYFGYFGFLDLHLWSLYLDLSLILCDFLWLKILFGQFLVFKLYVNVPKIEAPLLCPGNAMIYKLIIYTKVL